jgi:hypothetical protein
VAIVSYVDWRRHTANAYERRTEAVASDPCQWMYMSAKSDRQTRVGGPCSGGVVGAAKRRAKVDHETKKARLDKLQPRLSF